ncbi:hypothetical protein [Halanaerobaculum tunisiense]
MNNLNQKQKQSSVEILGMLDQFGYLSVKISNCILSVEEIKFFGVEQFGFQVTGDGVSVSQIKKVGKDLIVLFDIRELLSKKQINSQIVEGVIKVDGREIGRDKLSISSFINSVK